MSKILSYNKKTSGEGWIALTNQYSADEINMIEDPNGGLSVQPRTAIPSPFAQMDLVKNAFRRLAMDASLNGELMDEKLVGNALDVAQLFFNLPELSTTLHVVEWSKVAALQMLASDPRHQLLGDTIAMFLEQDKEAFNFRPHGPIVLPHLWQPSGGMHIARDTLHGHAQCAPWPVCHSRGAKRQPL